jgi:hypothetical protein
LSEFDEFQQILGSEGGAAALAHLADRFLAEKKYPLLFEVRLMQKRHELKLPLIQIGNIGDVPDAVRPAYEQGFIAAAREVGALFLQDGDIARAWSYLRAIGEPGPVASAIEKVQEGEAMDRIIEIAFQEGVNPRRGFELVLQHYGICRAISYYQQFPSRNGRSESLQLLVRTLHRELVESLKRSIAQAEGTAPETQNVSELLAGREWLFEGGAYYIDTSHVASIIQLTPELDDEPTIRLALEITDYGKRLDSMFQFPGEPPFQNLYEDHAIYLRALLGEDVESAIAHFQAKIEPDDTIPAQVLVDLLTRLKRYREAIDISLVYLSGVDSAHLACPTVSQLCQLAEDYTRLREHAIARQDVLSFAAAAISES